MLKFIYRYWDVDFSDLLDVYSESLILEGAERYPYRSEYDQRILAEEDLREYLRFFFSNGGILAIWLHDQQPVSAVRLEPYQNGYLVAGLETAPNHRGKGFATLLMNSVCEFLQARTPLTLYSHVKRSNKRSLRVHEKCGFGSYRDYAVLLDGSVDTKSDTMIREL